MALRLFVAMDVPQELKDTLGAAIPAAESVPGMKWVRPENVHFTLKFLGNVEEEKLDRLTKAVRDVADAHAAMEISTGGYGAFPRPERARVFWLGLEKGKQELTSLAKDLDRRLRKLGFEAEKRPFASHVTLARLRQPRDIIGLIQDWELRAGTNEVSWQGRELVLYQSVLDRTGPTYTALERFALKE